VAGRHGPRRSPRAALSALPLPTRMGGRPSNRSASLWGEDRCPGRTAFQASQPTERGGVRLRSGADLRRAIVSMRSVGAPTSTAGRTDGVTALGFLHNFFPLTDEAAPPRDQEHCSGIA
jgi:hypothetical protein